MTSGDDRGPERPRPSQADVPAVRVPILTAHEEARRVSLSQARRIALEAQGFGRPRPSGRVSKGHLRRVFDHVGIVQIDAVNVLVRSHYLPFFSRLGPYDRGLLDRLDGPKGEIVEYWGHEASFVPKETWPLLAWRMRDQNGWHLLRATAKANEDALQRLREVVAERGPITATELEPRRTPKEPWWDWNLTKLLLEFLFLSGEISAVRLGNFARAYVSLDHVLDGQVPRRDQITDHEAARQSLLLAARCYGVGTARIWPTIHGWGSPRLAPSSTTSRSKGCCTR